MSEHLKKKQEVMKRGCRRVEGSRRKEARREIGSSMTPRRINLLLTANHDLILKILMGNLVVVS